MQRFVKVLLAAALLLAPVAAPAAQVKAFQHVQSVYFDEKGGSLATPEGVACEGNSEFLVADTGNGRLIRYKIQDDKVVASPEMKLPQLPYPVRLQLDSKGNILALDEKVQRIAKLTPQGAFSGYLEAKGVPGAEKMVPRSFKLDKKGNVYVLDIGANRVLELDPAGNYLRQIPFPVVKGFFSDLAVVGGDVFLLNSADPAVFVAAKGKDAFVEITKNLREYAAFPTYLTSDDKGLLYLADQNGDGIVTLGYDGSFVARRLVLGWNEGQINYPSQFCMQGNQVILTDRGNSRVQIFEIVR